MSISNNQYDYKFISDLITIDHIKEALCKMKTYTIRVQDIINLTLSRKRIKGLENYPFVSSMISEAEFEVLFLICEEFTSAEIAATRFTSKKTVETHRKNLLNKLNHKGSIGLMKWAIKNDLYKLK